MRLSSVMILLLLCNCVNATSAHWTGIGLSNYEGFDDNTVSYWFSGHVYGENGESTWFHTDIEGHVEADGLHLKQFDFAQEMMNPTFNWWALALYGDIVSETTFVSLNQIEYMLSDRVYAVVTHYLVDNSAGGGV